MSDATNSTKLEERGELFLDSWWCFRAWVLAQHIRLDVDFGGIFFKHFFWGLSTIISFTGIVNQRSLLLKRNRGENNDLFARLFFLLTSGYVPSQINTRQPVGLGRSTRNHGNDSNDLKIKRAQIFHKEAAQDHSSMENRHVSNEFKAESRRHFFLNFRSALAERSGRERRATNEWRLPQNP